MKLLRIIPLMALCFLFLKCNKGDTPTDTCINKNPFQADFTIEEKVGDTSFVTDKILAPGYLILNAKGEYDSVRWYIGGPQNTSDLEKYTLYFNNEEGAVDVTFIGYRKPDLACFPNDKSSDTVNKTFEVIKRDEHATIVGQYYGYNESNPADKFRVAITYYNNVWGYFLKNIPKGCPGYTIVDEGYPSNIGLSLQAGNAAFKIKQSSRACSEVIGKGYLKSSDTLVIEYSFYPLISSNPYSFESVAKKDKFIGIRQP